MGGAAAAGDRARSLVARRPRPTRPVAVSAAAPSCGGVGGGEVGAGAVAACGMSPPAGGVASDVDTDFTLPKTLQVTMLVRLWSGPGPCFYATRARPGRQERKGGGGRGHQGAPLASRARWRSGACCRAQASPGRRRMAPEGGALARSSPSRQRHPALSARSSPVRPVDPGLTADRRGSDARRRSTARGRRGATGRPAARAAAFREADGPGIGLSGARWSPVPDAPASRYCARRRAR